jgi:hypothetical protein
MKDASAFSPLRILFDIPAQYRAAARWVLDHASTVWGVPVTNVSSSDSADLIYSLMPGAHSNWMRFDPACYEPGGSFALHDDHGESSWASGADHSDLLGGVYRLLALLDEAAIDPLQRNSLGVFDTSALPQSRRAVLARPLVEHHLEQLWERVADVRPDLHRPPLWPGSKRWACVVTHDTDAVSLGRTRELLYNTAKLFLRREPVRARMVLAGLRQRRRPMRDPYFGFPTWRRVEAERDVRSAFYLFVIPKGVRRHLHDSRSAVTDPGIDVAPLREMADMGWEFGLHASIYARHRADGLRKSRELLEAYLNRPIQGLRHHYWALDWERPWRTFRQHAAAGFRYDSSLAWRDVPGYRAGTSLPFRPFDPEHGRPIGLWELPAAIMDGHILERSSAGSEEAALAVIEETRSVGGVLVLNWHTETANQVLARAAYRDAFERILDRVLTSGDAWITTPNQLLDHWGARAALGR